ncbi:MAG: GlsB/YeaQ/YmgE family stress response membrane protein [Proteobacteria bacterium]|nr:GlsB/YeaQ/YmgE family stress response membrane protein [Pseudomonadota bacterium]
MGLVGSVIIGFLLGVIAKLLMPNLKNGIFKITEIIGIFSAIFAYESGILLGFYQPNNPFGYLVASLGSMFLLGLYGLALKRKKSLQRRI